MAEKEEKKVPEIRFKRFSDDWEKHKLGELGNTFTGISGKTKKDFGHGNARYVTYLNVFKNPITSKSNWIKLKLIENKMK
ncbi:hypothetical protein [Fructilactobacillus carniphilus]|uniref:Restriction endonuclease subunit S n=1 Tax=Fructilactobacillus carniphilus TaxID=2940297 RepID=A0ABY5BWN4_9LACO|nr:hypothetical protein [Fructilactobacillus carniphilus]USS90656.1 hypothetical protein M3M37_00025 [Fructilactobacillus carniphilus]